MVPLAGLIDTAFLGHLADIRHLAGVALATVIFNVVYWSFGFLRMGTTGTTAQARGRSDQDEIWLIPLRNGLIAIALASLILLLQVPIRTLGFTLLGAEASVEAAGMDYFNRQIWGAPAVLLNLVLLGWFLGQEKGRWVVLLSLVGNGGNVLLNYWFIRRLGWASGGAGLATALSQYLMLAIGLGLLLQMGGWDRLRQVASKAWDPQALGSLFRLNRDIMVRTFALLLSFSLFTSFSAGLGTEILAANTLLLQVVTFSAYFIDGIAFATESMAGRLHGGGQAKQLRSLLAIGGITSVGLGIGFALSFGLLPKTLFGLLTIHQPVVDRASAYVGWLLPILGLGAIAYLLDGYFLGLTAGKTLRNATLVAAGVGFLPLALAARAIASPHLLWLALASFMAARALTLMAAVPKSLGNPRPPLA
ncbi:MATE family efflux transporter [filamentous cyanobacterium CCP5]|nr:MATE family efflux transporter [filamentous cyanobacterium CCP5]